MSQRALGGQFIDLHRGVVLGASEHFPEDRHVAAALAPEPGAWWTRDPEHAARYAGKAGQVGAVLHARVPTGAVRERRTASGSEVFLPGDAQPQVLGHTVVRR